VRIPWTHGYAERKSLPLHQNMPFCPFPPLRSIDPDPFLPFPASMVVESIPPPPAPSLSDRPTQKVAHDLFPNPLFLKRLRPPPGGQSSAIWTGPIEPPAAGDQDISDSIDHLVVIDARSSDLGLGRPQGFNERPRLVRQRSECHPPFPSPVSSPKRA